MVVVAFNRAHLRPLGQSSVLMCTLFQPLAAVCPVTGVMTPDPEAREISQGLWESGRRRWSDSALSLGKIATTFMS